MRWVICDNEKVWCDDERCTYPPDRLQPHSSASRGVEVARLRWTGGRTRADEGRWEGDAGRWGEMGGDGAVLCSLT